LVSNKTTIDQKVCFSWPLTFHIGFTEAPPDTRSGKIMRYLLRELATHGEISLACVPLPTPSAPSKIITPTCVPALTSLATFVEFPSRISGIDFISRSGSCFRIFFVSAEVQSI
jgi:hypothetical protein